MRITFHFALLAVACTASVATPSLAQERVPTVSQTLTAFPQLNSHSELPARASVDDLGPDGVERAPAFPITDTGTIGPTRAPAPPLTDMWVYGVGSTNCGWEYTSGLSTTTCRCRPPVS